MAQIIPTIKSPNQTFFVVLDGVNYEISLQTSLDLLFITIVAEEETLCTSVAVCNNQPILYDFQKRGGQFYMLCDDEEYPSYDKLGESANLIYVSDSE